MLKLLGNIVLSLVLCLIGIFFISWLVVPIIRKTQCYCMYEVTYYNDQGYEDIETYNTYFMSGDCKFYKNGAEGIMYGRSQGSNGTTTYRSNVKNIKLIDKRILDK